MMSQIWEPILWPVLHSQIGKLADYPTNPQLVRMTAYPRIQLLYMLWRNHFCMDEVMNRNNKLLNQICPTSYQVWILNSQIPLKVVAGGGFWGQSEGHTHWIGTFPWPCVLDPTDTSHPKKDMASMEPEWNPVNQGLFLPRVRRNCSWTTESAPTKVNLFPSRYIFTYVEYISISTVIAFLLSIDIQKILKETLMCFWSTRIQQDKGQSIPKLLK